MHAVWCTLVWGRPWVTLDSETLTLTLVVRRGVGDLVLVYKRVTSLAGHTSRVAELLEQVQRLSAGNPDDTTASLCAP